MACLKTKFDLHRTIFIISTCYFMLSYLWHSCVHKYAVASSSSPFCNIRQQLEWHKSWQDFCKFDIIWSANTHPECLRVEETFKTSKIGQHISCDRNQTRTSSKTISPVTLFHFICACAVLMKSTGWQITDCLIEISICICILSQNNLRNQGIYPYNQRALVKNILINSGNAW